ARGAASTLLDWLGFEDVDRDGNEKVIAATPEEIPGYILTRFADTYGRCVAFAFKGNRAGKTGDEVYFRVEELKRSLNFHLLESGVAYPTFYSQLFPDIRRAMAEAVGGARQCGRGVWAKDLTLSGFNVPGSVEAVQESAYILPKLYRRLTDYFALNGGDTALDGFREWLNENDDRVLILPEGHQTSLDQAVDVDGQRVKLTTLIENLIFEEK
ncbi:MAG: nuclease, partial [Polyangiales bacterium]